MNKLDQLQESCEKMVLLLKDRQVGFISWTRILIDNCQALTELLLKDGSVCPVCHQEIDEMKGRYIDSPPTGEKDTFSEDLCKRLNKMEIKGPPGIRKDHK